MGRGTLDRAIDHGRFAAQPSGVLGVYESFGGAASLFVSSLGTSWGLFRHYWVLVKLLIILTATIVLLVHMHPISVLAGVATRTTVTLSSAEIHGLRDLLVTAAVAALLVLLVLTALSMYKPRGMTRYGWRKQHEQRALSHPQV